ncbi:ABC transporter permease [Pseudonocardia humida]|uniref:ABC transporter permease n=1 Tax=Pseudonocardia humida TaxID=2800819 RepID=A0ABT1A2S3_9PSEU|nr:ABC transporter permease [Pseudonocardia humida]MCO1657293.1 ABC transporter permease [Pseudonocardia humida]
MRRVVRGVIGFAGFLLVWELFSRSGVVREEFLPPPTTVFARLAVLLTEPPFVADVVATVLAWLIAVVIASAIAVPLGLLLGSVPSVAAASRALVEFLRPIPSVALIPLVIVLLGVGPETKITLAVYASLWPLLFNTIYAMSEIDPVQVDTARAFGLSRSRILWTVQLPHAAPFVMTGVRISASIALILVISTELLAGGSGGLGQVIFDAGAGGGRMDIVLSATLVAGVIGFLGNAALEKVQRRWLGWDDQIDAGR